MKTSDIQGGTMRTLVRGWCAAVSARSAMRIAVVSASSAVKIAGACMTLIVLAACSDDVVCPDIAPQANVYVSARIEERSSATTGTTVRVAATADPLLSLLAVFVNETQLTDVEADGLDLVASLDDGDVLWQPGTRCSLRVTTNYGFATSGLTVPEAADVQAPPSVAPGETLTISWSSAGGADYYMVAARLTGTDLRKHGALPGSGPADQREELFSVATTGTVYAYVVPIDAPAGVVSGTVDAVSGPYPQSGQEGNISGDAWGFFTSSYGDSGSGFSVQISLPGAGSWNRSRPREDVRPP
jgi:hypothetical protein